MNDMRSVAFDLALQGFKVFPLREGGKLPLPDISWKGLVCANEMDAWELWTQPQFRKSNVGIHCEGLIVVDVDDYKAVTDSGVLDTLGLPPTRVVKTARGGYHLYFSGPDVANSASKLAPGIDVRGVNGYVVGPGSVTENGSYEVIEDRPVATAPQSLIDKCKAAKESQSRESVDWGAVTSPTRLEDGRQFLSTARVSVEGCGGNDTAFRTISELWDKGVTASGTLDLLLEGWNERCLPPWSDDELRGLIHHVHTYAKNEFGCRAADNIFGMVVIPAPEQPEDDFDMISAASFQDKPIPVRRWYVDEWIPSNNVTLLYGDGSVGKSLASLQLLAAGVAGAKWFGMDVDKGPVIVLSAEEEYDDIHARLWDIIKPFGTFASYRDLHIVSRAGKDAGMARFDRDENMITTAVYAKLVAKIALIRPKLVILDNLADIFHGNEISKNQARSFVNLLRSICIQLDTTIVVLAHPSQSGMQSGSGTSGNTAWSNSVRSRLYMQRDETQKVNNKVDKNYRTLTVMKANYSAVGLEVRMRYSEGRFVLAAPAADVQLERDKDLAHMAFLFMQEAGLAKVATLEVAKALIGKHVDVTAKFKDSNGSNAQAKAYIAQILSGGVTITDDLGNPQTISIDGDFVVY
ncbi:Prim_Pol domain containing protein [uncultured Caudovirales phage]|uniref:Prim_Pol domain containing protein n=1 Tax=uncultured Caudovirales phage TaxID=2100421 RepID=A0A6J5KZ14_9CAUD|nr:Prim_Pol domain containing protein [uncultured Caudovirales phage]